MDPRNAPEDYFRSYFNIMNVSEDREDLKEELLTVFGEGYDEQWADEFLRDLGLLSDSDQDDADNEVPRPSVGEQVSDPKGQGDTTQTETGSGPAGEKNAPTPTEEEIANLAFREYVNQRATLLT